MGYKTALEAAGAKIVAFESFGSYQGTWLAFVEYRGEKGIVEGAFGSCSYCDAFQREFDYDSEPETYNGCFYKNGNTWDDENKCTEQEYYVALAKYDNRLAKFGRSYLEAEGTPSLYDKAHYEHRLSLLQEDDWFDGEEKEYIEWAINQFNNN